MRLTRHRRRLLEAARNLDNIHLGMLAGPADVPEETHRECVEAGWLRTKPFDEPWGVCYFLTTKGLRRLKAAEKPTSP